MPKLPLFEGLAKRALLSVAIATLSTTALAQSSDLTALQPTVAATSTADAVSRFLVDRGLLGAMPAATVPATPGTQGFVGQVRDKASDMVETAMNFLGVRYRRGGTSVENGFDCSGFTRQVFESSLGLILPRRAEEQARAEGMVAIKRDELQPGDLVFFNTLRRTFSHVGIYVGDGKFIHSPKPGGEVRVDDMRFVYWAKRFTGARRAEPLAEEPGSSVAATARVPTLR